MYDGFVGLCSRSTSWEWFLLHRVLHRGFYFSCLLFPFAFELSVLSTGVEKVNLTSGRDMEIKFSYHFNSLNIFSGARKGASSVPMCCIICSGWFISSGQWN